jgi:Ca2+-binding RTX toxin-like protein
MDVVVTVSGATYTFEFPTSDAAAEASAIANAINAEGGINTDVVGADGVTFVGTAYDSIVIDALGAASVVASSSVSVIGGSNGTAFFGAAGSTDEVAFAGGDNTISAGNGSTFTIATGSGNDLIYASGTGSVDAGAGSNTILASGTTAVTQTITSYGVGDVIATGAESATVAEGGSNATIFVGSGPDVVADTGTADTVVGGSGAMTTFGGSAGVYFLSSGSNLFVAGTSPVSSDTIIGATSGTETVSGGTSDVVFTEMSSLIYVAQAGSAATINGGSGDVTVFGASGSDVHFYAQAGAPAASELLQLNGNETINAASSQASLYFIGGGSGSALLVGSTTGPDNFIFDRSVVDVDTIKGFGGQDFFDLSGYGDSELAVDLANATHADGNTTITTSDGSEFTFINVTALSQTSDDTFTAICFCAGTRILTPQGDIAVETLSIGDPVVTAGGQVVPVRWIGRNTVSNRFADPLRVLPIRIRAGALAENRPARDLLVSPDHAILVGDILIQAGALVNGVSILRERAVPEVFTYYHVELADHALIVAEGTPAETFVDNVHRAAFDNWAEHKALYGDAPIAEMPYARAQSHRQVPTEIHANLLARAAAVYGPERVAV